MLPLPDSPDSPPSGCKWCGFGQRHHRLRFSTARELEHGEGTHTYEHPTSAQVKARMLERRDAQTAAKGTAALEKALHGVACTWTPETGHPRFRTYLGDADDRLPTITSPTRGHHSAPGGLRVVRLGEYLTQVPSAFLSGTKEER